MGRQILLGIVFVFIARLASAAAHCFLEDVIAIATYLATCTSGAIKRAMRRDA